MSKNVFSKKISLLTMLCAGVVLQTHAVEHEWWFDVEVILFERNLDAVTISEKFKQSKLVPPDSDHLDLLTPFLKPDLSFLRAGLTYCRTSNQLAIKNQYEEDFTFPLPEVEAEKTELAEGVDNYEAVVTDSDVIAPSDIEGQLSQSLETDELKALTAGIGKGENTESQENLLINEERYLPRPPIVVEFIEWQIPSVFPCAYAEQIDASFASITTLQKSINTKQTSPQIKRVPDIINGIEWTKDRNATLLSTQTMFMTDLYEKIKKQRDIKPLVHLNWRQQVEFGRENGQTFRIFAGENFAEKFTADGKAIVANTDDLFASLEQPAAKFYIPEEEYSLLTPEQQQALFAQIDGATTEVIEDDLFSKIDATLADDSPINFELVDTQPEVQSGVSESTVAKELWRIDGGIAVYLRNVGRIPYLHIDSNLDFRQPIFNPQLVQNPPVKSLDVVEKGPIAINQPQQANYLQSVNFNQLRRVISKQVHYFDHPLFGMIVHINRYRWPEVTEESELPEDDSEAVPQ